MNDYEQQRVSTWRLRELLQFEKDCVTLRARAEAADQQIEQLQKEVCICAAIQLTDGRIIRGHRHDDCIQTAIKWGVVERVTQEKQGFITSRNRYVSRREGADLQIAAGIKSAHHGGDVREMLFSEDLYFEDGTQYERGRAEKGTQ